MRIRWTEPAALDLTGICDYVHEHDRPEAARRIALRIYEAVDSLASLPHRGRFGRSRDTRELLVRGLPYIVVYPGHEDVVEINRILHGARMWPSPGNV